MKDLNNYKYRLSNNLILMNLRCNACGLLVAHTFTEEQEGEWTIELTEKDLFVCDNCRIHNLRKYIK